MRTDYFFDQRYRLAEDEFCLTSYEQEMILELRPGEKVCFTNLLCPSREQVSAELLVRDGKIWAAVDGRMQPTPFAAYPFWQKTGEPLYPPAPAEQAAGFHAEVSCLKALDGGEAAVGLRDGRLLLLKNGGKWTEAVKMEGEVHDVLLYNGKRFAAFGERSLACFGMDGKPSLAEGDAAGSNRLSLVGAFCAGSAVAAGGLVSGQGGAGSRMRR